MAKIKLLCVAMLIVGFTMLSGKIMAQSNAFKSVKIGKQVWMSENLNVDKFRNGDAIPQAKTVAEWTNARDNKKPAWCYYQNSSANGTKYGKLYNWYAVNDARGLAPKGWHIPSDAEWTQLSNFIGGKGTEGKKMKSTSGWNKNGNGTNESGFSGLPAGLRSTDGSFYNLGDLGYWWSATENYSKFAWYRYLYNLYDKVYRATLNKEDGLSVRCVKD
jgi:uncharacterized protein (TIGR02145 family)